MFISMLLQPAGNKKYITHGTKTIISVLDLIVAKMKAEVENMQTSVHPVLQVIWPEQ